MTWAKGTPPSDLMKGRTGAIVTLYIEDSWFRCGGYTCPWCKSRCETGITRHHGDLPSVDDYSLLLNQYLSCDIPPACVSINGAQPFHPLYVAHTKALWSAAMDWGVPVCAVASGDGIPEAMPWISKLPSVPTILISKDAPDALNAELRGSNNHGQSATEIANSAMDALIQYPAMRNGYARIATTVIKGQEHWAFDLIATFPDNWKSADVPIVFGPQLIEREGEKTRFAHSPNEFVCVVQKLRDRCLEAGVECIVDDTFNQLHEFDDMEQVAIASLEGRDLVRIGPDLSIRMNDDVLHSSLRAMQVTSITEDSISVTRPG